VGVLMLARRPQPRQTCMTCMHWRKVSPSESAYDHCVRVNVREDWGDLKYIPVSADDTCSQHQPKGWTESDGIGVRFVHGFIYALLFSLLLYGTIVLFYHIGQMMRQ
jgi:hypothetical protein